MQVDQIRVCTRKLDVTGIDLYYLCEGQLHFSSKTTSVSEISKLILKREGGG